jgi:hypothetical protein
MATRLGDELAIGTVDEVADEPYDVFRNPLVHSGRVTSKPHLSGAVAGVQADIAKNLEV